MPKTLETLFQFLDSKRIGCEVILVIEPSKDNTLEVAKKWEQKRKEIKIIKNKIRLGKGGTVRRGMIRSNGEYAMFMDADGATDYQFIEEALNEAKNHREQKIFIASRHMKNSVMPIKQTVFRRLASKVFRLAVQLILSLPYKDTQCGCKMFHQSVVPIIFKKIQEKGFAFDIELLLKAKIHKIEVKEMPCIWRDQEGSTVQPVKDGLKMYRAILQLKRKYKKGVL